MLKPARSFAFLLRPININPNRAVSASSLWNKVRSVMGANKALIPATSIFHNCQDQANNQWFYSSGKVPPDFKSKHAVLMTHIWMVHKRLLHESIPHGKDIQEALFDYLWEDTSSRMRQQKVNELSLNKHLKGVQAFSFKLCIELDQSIKMEKEEDVIADIGGAVWRSVYDRKESLSDAHVLEFARYIRREQLSLAKADPNDIIQGTFKWGEKPQWKRLGRDDSPAAAPSEWKEAISMEGKTYYWNVRTRESRWDLPADASGSNRKS